MKPIALLFFLFVFKVAIPQKGEQAVTNEISFMISAGKFFSNYRYYKYYDGFENVNISLSKKLSNRFGLSINQNYGRMFNKRINNKAKVYHTTLNLDFIPVKYKKLLLELSFGGGIQQIHNKCLYESYPYTEHIYGSTINGKASIVYHLTQKIALNINYNLYRAYLFFNDNNYVPQDPYYYKTTFSSVNMGLQYTFRKTK